MEMTDVMVKSNDDFPQYETISESDLELIKSQHSWIVKPLYRASDLVLEMPFYQWLNSLKSPRQFAQAAKQLYFHSATFPKVLGFMLGLTSLQNNHMMPFYAKHAFGEADHCQLLLNWLVKHRLLDKAEHIDNVIPTPETNACINLAYPLAIEQDQSKWIITINCAIERCSNDFFKVLAPKMQQLGVGDLYFDIHVEADEHHSIMGLEYIEQEDPNSIRGQQLIAKGLEGISAWAAMLHSWIGISYHPKFNLKGELIGG